MAPQIRRKGNGRHTTGPQTIPDPEDTMSTPPTAQPTAPDDVLDDWLDAYERAQQRADLAKNTIPGLNDTISNGELRADRLREEARDARARAQQLIKDADDKDADASELLIAIDALKKKLDKAHENVARHTKTANHHGGNISAEIAKGAEDPRARRDRRAKQAREQGAPQPHPNPLQQQGPGLSPLDGPRVPIGPEPTAPFHQHDLDAAQATQAAGGAP